MSTYQWPIPMPADPPRADPVGNYDPDQGAKQQRPHERISPQPAPSEINSRDVENNCLRRINNGNLIECEMTLHPYKRNHCKGCDEKRKCYQTEEPCIVRPQVISRCNKRGNDPHQQSDDKNKNL